MKIDIYSLFLEISSKIQETFPTVNVWIEEIPETGELFVLIDDENVYSSVEFQDIVTHINIDLLWKNGILNIYFGIDEINPLPESVTITSAAESTEIYLDIEDDQYDQSHSSEDEVVIISQAA